MSTRAHKLNGKQNLGYVNDEITELPGTVSANEENGSKLEETTSEF